MIDIQKEREAFEKFKAKQIDIDYETLKKDLDDCEKRFPNNRYAGWNFKSDWELWQASTAQAVPEGFVLVPREMPKSFDEGLYFYSNSISVVNEHSDGFIPMSDIDHSEIWKLVIEAQEQNHD